MGMFSAELNANELNVQNIMPTAGTIKNFFVFVQSVPGAGASWTMTVRNNGADTAVTCTITGAAAQSCSDTTHTAVFAAGDLIAIRIASSGGPNATPGQWTAQFAP